MHCSIILVLFALVVITIVTCTQDGICYKQSKVGKPKTKPLLETEYKQSTRYKKCGKNDGRRCPFYLRAQRTFTKGYYLETVYETSQVCCSKYIGTAPNCIPVCEEASCINGYCIEPDTCECEINWTGRTCRDDENLLNWCSSISNRKIENNFQSKVRTSLQVYCGATTNHSFISYNHDKTSYVAPKVESDSNRCPDQYKQSLYQFWMQHPNIQGYCCYPDPKYHITLIKKLFNFDNNFYSYIGGLASTVAIELREELITLCSVDMSDSFCSLKTILDIIDVSLRLPADKSEWTDTTQTYKNAVLISFAILKRKYPEYADIVLLDEDFEEDIIIECTNIILKHIQNKQVSQLRTFATYLPPNDAYLPKSTSCRTDRLCIIMKMVEQVRMYLDEANLDTNPILVNGKKRLILNTAVDYREFLRRKQLDRIVTVLAEQQSTSIQIANDLKEHTTTKFTEIRSYFENVETFNQQIASADIGFIKGRLTKYARSATEIVTLVKKDMAALLILAFEGVGFEVAEKIVILAMTIAERANPLKWIIGDVSIKDIIEATADLANSLAKRAELGTIQTAFNNLKDTISDIAERLDVNKRFLEDVKVLVFQETATREQFEKSKSMFVAKYGEYSPQVTNNELEAVSSLWNTLIDATCDIIDGLDGSAANGIKLLVKSQAYCIDLKTHITNMTSLYDEIYDYQFDLMDAMAAYVRSSVALDAAKEISTEFTEIVDVFDNDASLSTLAIMGGLTYVSYQFHILQTVHLYCNVLEYMEGGNQPSECKGVHTNIALLIASTEPVCRSETTRFYPVPTRSSSSNSSNEMAYIDIDQLFAGDEVSFKIPSSDWLVENEWIRASERSHSFYVKKFEIFLPTKIDYPHMFYTTATPVLHNEVIPGSTEYIIIPEMPLYSWFNRIYHYT